MAAKKTWDKIVAFCIGLLVVLANFWHVIDRWLENPKDRYFIGIAHYFADYFLYVSQINQGVAGRIIFSINLFSNEPLPPTWVYWPNVLLGRIGSLVTQSPFAIYIIGLFINVSLLLVVWYRLISKVFPKQPFMKLVAFLFVTTASNFPDVVALVRQGVFRLQGDTWFSPTPALNRLGGVPHQTLQTVLLLVIILAFDKLLNHPQKNKLLAVIFTALCFVAATVTPVQMLMLSGAMLTTTVFIWLKRNNLVQFVGVASGILAAALGGILVNRAFDSSVLYALAKQWEAAQTVRISLSQFLMASGPIIFLVPFGIKPFLTKPSPLQLVLFVFSLSSVVSFFSPLPHLLSTSPVRWLSPAAYGVLPIIAASGLVQVASWLSRTLSKIMNYESEIKTEKTQGVFLGLFIILYSLLTIPALLSQVAVRLTPLRTDPTLYTLNHVPQPVLNALNWLSSNNITIQSPPLAGSGQETGQSNNFVVLTDPLFPYDVLVPAVSGRISFTGHPVHTLYPQTKEDLRRWFFSGNMSESEAMSFFKNHNIKVVLASASAARLLSKYTFLVQSFQNEAATIYIINE